MCQVKCRVEAGLIPAERVVQIWTVDGHEEEVAVAAHEGVAGESLTAALIHQDEQRVLIELSRESASGRWRIWVDRSTLVAAKP